MEKEFLAQYFYNEGVRRFKPDDNHIDHEARKCYFRVSYDLCVELSFFPDFFSTLCLELANDKLSGRVLGPELKDVIEILETGKKHCANPDTEKTIDQKIKECHKWFDDLCSAEKGISNTARDRFHGIERLEELWGKDFNFHDCWISKFNYDRLAGTITLDLIDPDADYENPKEWATLRFNEVKEFTFNAEPKCSMRP